MHSKTAHFYRIALLVLLCGAIFIGHASAQDITANLTDSCVTDFDPSVDYFPDKSSVQYAEGLEIEYFNNYKVISVLNPWRGAESGIQYVLVQCGTPAPEGYGGDLMIEIPAGDVIVMSTTQVPHFDQLGLLDHIVALDSFNYISNENVQAMIDAGELEQISYGADLNLELTLELDPDVVMTYAVGYADTDSHPVLLDAGIPTVLNAEWTEISPLARSEWIKFTAAFFNEEAQAKQIFGDIAARYEEISALAAEVEDRPTVLLDVPYQGTWYIPGGASYMAQLLADAGADYPWADDETTGSIPLDFESVYEQANDADFWINILPWSSLDDGLLQDERYGEFASFQNGNVYANDLRSNIAGGNDFYETGVTNPDVLLADLIKIFHPELLPDHEFYFYRHVE